MIKLCSLLLTFFLISTVQSSEDYFGQEFAPSLKSNLQYKAFFGRCPSQTAGDLALTIIKAFEKDRSLGKIKQLILKDGLQEKNFLMSYDMTYDPIRERLNLKFDCPIAMSKVQVIKSKKLDQYDAVLVETGELVDPMYEVLLKEDKKIMGELPSLSITLDKINDPILKDIAQLLKSKKLNYKNELAEIILDTKNNLSLIFSFDQKATTVYLGSNHWETKIDKLTTMLGYLSVKEKIPSIINLTNEKKVVVKFRDTL